jgi:glycine oxidase
MNDLVKTADVVVVGGGVIGLAVARALSLRGLRDVLLIERNGLGAEASFAAAGMLAPQAEADCADEFFYLACESRDLYPAFAAALHVESGIDVELETTGTLYLAFTEHDANEVDKRYQWQSEAGLAVERLTAAAARSLEPAISAKVLGALKFPLDMQVENRRLINALAVSNEKFGVRMVTNTTVESLTIIRGCVAGVETSRGYVATENVVIASGAWASMLKAGDKALPDLGIEPVRGQMLSFAARPQVSRHVVYSPRGYIVPRNDGRLLAGSTTEKVGFDKRVTDQGIQSIMSAAIEISPQILKLPLSASWAGLRPRAADDLPVIGACAEIEGIWYATGHYRNGILLAPITGELIARAIVDKVVPPVLSTFSPDRFGLVPVN